MREKNSFDLLRLIFALFVLISHSYPLSGSTTGDILRQVTNGQVSFSYIGLLGFFSISGYFVMKSLNNSTSLLHYVKKRVLRIYPAYAVMLIFTVILCYFVYDYDLNSYLHNRSMWMYIPRKLSFVFLQESIDGVFTRNVYGTAINGSLWSLLYEVSFYAALALLFFFNRKQQIILLISLLTALFILRAFLFEELGRFNFIVEWPLVVTYAPFFFSGSLLSLLKPEKWNYCLLIAFSLILILMLSIYLQSYAIVVYITLPLIVILLGECKWPPANNFISLVGDLSYGTYIYAFLVQQTLMYFFALDAIELMITSALLSVLCAIISWNLIEKRALQLKPNS